VARATRFQEGADVMSEMERVAWPVTEIDAGRRPQELVASVPGAIVVERVIPMAMDSAWAVASELK
jgi:hypothetical protein